MSLTSLIDRHQGDADFICNWLGNHAWTEALEWPGKKAFNKVPLGNLTLDSLSTAAGRGRTTGEYKTSGNFTFIKLHAGGHMVPLDQPEASLDMFNRWLSGEFWEQ